MILLHLELFFTAKFSFLVLTLYFSLKFQIFIVSHRRFCTSVHSLLKRRKLLRPVIFKLTPKKQKIVQLWMKSSLLFFSSIKLESSFHYFVETILCGSFFRVETVRIPLWSVSSNKTANLLRDISRGRWQKPTQPQNYIVMLTSFLKSPQTIRKISKDATRKTGNSSAPNDWSNPPRKKYANTGSFS